MGIVVRIRRRLVKGLLWVLGVVGLIVAFTDIVSWIAARIHDASGASNDTVIRWVIIVISVLLVLFATGPAKSRRT